LKSAQFKSTIAEIFEVESTDFKHPLLTYAKFILLDDQGNDNKQGVKADDFTDIINTAIDMPVKILYTGKDVRGHIGSIPVGHIKSIEKVSSEGANQLIATAVLYADEYPDEITYLKEAYAAGSAPGISYELLYKDSMVEDGIEWLKKITTKAATFVRTPAYGSRTAILALASNAELSPEAFVENVAELMHEWKADDSNESKDEGGNENMELEKMLEDAKAEAATKQSEIERLTTLLNDKDAEITALNTQIDTFRRDALMGERERKFVEAGFSLESDAEKLAKKREFWASLSDEAFDAYISDLVSVKATVPAAAATAARKEGTPKLAVSATTPLTIDELRASMRSR
jgi:hypothetical protein